MNGKKRLKFILLGVVIFINIVVMGVVLSTPNDDIISELKNEIEERLSENINTSDEEVEYTVEDEENLNNNVDYKSSSDINNLDNINNGNNSNSNNNGYQDEVVVADKGYMNGNESREFLQQILDEKYSENGGIYIQENGLAYMLDGSLRTKEGHLVFYIGYFLNDEKPPYNGLSPANKLYRVAIVNSVTKEYTDFGYRNGRTYEELGFRNTPKRD